MPSFPKFLLYHFNFINFPIWTLAFYKIYVTIIPGNQPMILLNLTGGLIMATNPKYYIVEASALPTVFLKVAEAKRLLSTGEASTVNEATQMTDISRSAFYKYRDAVMPFQNMMTGRIITFQLLLQDEQGLLSSILSVFAQCKANIITINSIVPTNGCAVVTISAETMELNVSLEEMLRQIRGANGVIKAEVLAG